MFTTISDVAIDVSGNLYVTDSRNDRIRKITPGGMVSTLVGTEKRGHQDGIGTEATFDNPTAITIDATGNLFVVDNYHIIRKVTPDGTVSTLSDRGQYSGSEPIDGPIATTQFGWLSAIAVDARGNMYVADYNGTLVRKISAEGMVSILAGKSKNKSEWRGQHLGWRQRLG